MVRVNFECGLVIIDGLHELPLRREKVAVFRVGGSRRIFELVGDRCCRVIGVF